MIQALLSVLASGVFFLIFGQDASRQQVQRFVFEERTIEGKIRKPQLVLISVEQRPDFKPMVMQSLDHEIVLPQLGMTPEIETTPHDGAFTFEHMKIANFVP
ncbi:MAG: hypothetical protein JW795_20655 [Chitinivibrionales bacterium]|nr:hypothetical protein [Chitinivibrionales bacterium]